MAQATTSSRDIRGFMERCGLGALYRPMLIVVIALAVVFLVCILIRYVPATAAQGDTFTAEKLSEDSDASAEEQTVVVIDVAGCVVNPGVYELPEGSRVNDAVTIAGGVSADAYTTSTNLARRLVDGEQVYIPSVEEHASSAGISSSAGIVSSTTGGGASSGLVNINTATAEELETLDGIGEVTAEKIIDDRQSNGPFTSIEDIMRVSGIGESKFAAIEDDICI